MYQVKEIAYRKTKLISPDTFAGDISLEIESAHVDHLNLKSSLALYNSTLIQVLDQHAPLKRKFVPNQSQVPQFTESIRDEIRKCRQLEQIWGQDKTNSDKYHDFCSQHRLVSNLLFSTEKKYTSILFVNRGGIPNRCSGYVIAYLAEARNHHFPLGLQTETWQTISLISSSPRSLI